MLMTVTQRRVALETYHEICQHYYAEATLWQDRNYREWLEKMVAEDVHVWMPVLELRFAKDRRPEPTPENCASILNERYGDLKMRVEQLYTGLVWMEDPPSRIRYFISNVEAFEADDGEFEVRSNVLVTRHRRQDEVAQHSIGREDRLRRDGNGFRLVRRNLMVDARVGQDKNLYFFV
jgi:3-phenylpropionate/cinnamic acid dioxygenase small subunit